MTRWYCIFMLAWSSQVVAAADRDAGTGAREKRLQTAIVEASRDVQEATHELNALRKRLDAWRRPLADELETLRAEVQRLRTDAERLRTIRRQDELERQALERDHARLREEFTFVETVLQEYRRSSETRLHVAESALLRERLTLLDEQLAGADTPEAFQEAVTALFTLAREWNRQKLGGLRGAGRCLSPEGTELEGTFAVLGPAAYFAAHSGEQAGLVVSRTGSARPALFPHQVHSFAPAIAALAAGQEAVVPVDVSAGDALRVAERSDSLVDHLVAGGFVMVPLLLIGAAALVLTLWKAITLRAVRVPPARVLDEVAVRLREGRVEAARALVEQVSRPFDDLVRAGIEHRAVRKEHLEEIMHERALASIPVLDRHLGMLAVLGAVAPLLGLLGTVTGMIHTFELVTIFGTGDAKLLSGGISEALITTETGLTIAVPVLLVHALLTRRVRTLVSGLEQTVVGFVNRLHAPPEGRADD